MSKPWHDPRPISELPRGDDAADLAGVGLHGGDSILVYNPCDGWHLLWLMQWRLEDIHRCKCFTHWMPGPPEPAGFDRAAWLEASRADGRGRRAVI